MSATTIVAVFAVVGALTAMAPAHKQAAHAAPVAGAPHARPPRTSPGGATAGPASTVCAVPGALAVVATIAARSAVEFAPDGGTLRVVARAADGRARRVATYDVAGLSTHAAAAPRALRPRHVHAIDRDALAFSFDGRRQVVAARGRLVRRGPGRVRLAAPHALGTPDGVALSPDGRYLAATADDRLEVYDFDAGRVVFAADLEPSAGGAFGAPAFAGGGRVVRVDHGRGYGVVCDLARPPRAGSAACSTSIPTPFVLSADGRRALRMPGQDWGTSTWVAGFELYDLRTDETRAAPRRAITAGRDYSAALCADGTLAVVAHGDVLEVFRGATSVLRVPLRALGVHGRVRVAWSPRGDLAAVVHDGGVVLARVVARDATRR